MFFEFEGLDDLANVFTEIEESFREADYAPVLTEALTLIQYVHMGYFAGQHGPDGQPWAPLKPATVAAKGRSTILVTTGGLRASLGEKNGESIRLVEPKGDGDFDLYFGTFVAYAGYHQDPGPTSHLPQRQMVGVTDPLLDTISQNIADVGQAAALGKKAA